MRYFHYSLIRFISDPVRGDGLNLGVIVIDDQAKDGTAIPLRRFKARLGLFDPWSDPDVIARLLDNIVGRVGSHQASFAAQDARVATLRDLDTLSSTMKNQIQITRPKAYRAGSLKVAADDLFAELVSPRRRPPPQDRGMSLRKLRRLIRETVRTWGGDAIKIEEDKLERGTAARHYADFWLQAGAPIAALIAIPDDPDERDIAWARRDSIPTIASEFLSVNPTFKAVVVFPPNGHVPPKDFVLETSDLLSHQKGVIVTYADVLASQRDLIAPRLL